MAKYEPRMIAVTSAQGPRGIADVLVKPGQAKVTFLEDGESYVVSTADLKTPPIGGRWFVSLDGNKKKLFNIHPVKGIFNMRLVKFIASKDAEPAPKLDNRYPDNPTLKFTVLLGIVDGKEKGMEVTMSLRYWFREDIVDGKSLVGYEFHTHVNAQRNMNLLIDFCDAFGYLDYGPIPYSDNLLPGMEKRMLKAAKIIKIKLNDGWVDTILGGDETPDVE